ncbi:MAG TPA: DUF4258 domain-containing protein [Chloroflexi bacterium]|nr:DUF4258 domain-containing protein [Chloroflexota bacterium]
MVIMDVEDLFAYRRQLRVSDHALREAHKESLRARDVFHALFNGEVLEHYRDRQRVLVVGPLAEHRLHLHVVCDYADPHELVVTTVYIPDKPKWINDQVRARFTAP